MTGARRWLIWGLRLGLGGLFIVAGGLKLADPTAFAQEIANYQLWPVLAPGLAVTLPAMEIAAGSVLIAGTAPWRRAGALALALLAATFTGAVAWAAGSGLDISCACFGQGSGSVSWWTVARNVGLVAAAAAVLWLDRPQPA